MFSFAPSLMCADPLKLGEEVRELERAGVEFFHLDIMDGHFVPNIGLSLDLIRRLHAFTNVPLDVHLMVSSPTDYIPLVSELGISHVSFHLEATHNPIRLARALRAAGVRAGIALNPATPVDLIEHLIEEVDYIVAMTVEPGFAGQRFIPQVLDKLDSLRRMLQHRRSSIPIEVDGNLDLEMSCRCLALGAKILVGGTSSVFRRQNDLYSDCCSFRVQVEQSLRSFISSTPS